MLNILIKNNTDNDLMWCLKADISMFLLTISYTKSEILDILRDVNIKSSAITYESSKILELLNDAFVFCINVVDWIKINHNIYYDFDRLIANDL